MAVKQLDPTKDLDLARVVADQLGYLLDEDVQALGGLAASTTEAWRKRGNGPPYVRFGNRTLYPKGPLLTFLENLTRAPSRRSAKDLL